MQLPEYYKKPLFIAVLLHVLLMLVLVINFAPSLFRTEPSSAPMQTVHATTVTEASVNAEINKVRQQPALAKEAQEKEQRAQAQKLAQAHAKAELEAKQAQAHAKAELEVKQAQARAKAQLEAKQAQARAKAKLEAKQAQALAKAKLEAKEARAQATAKLAAQKKLAKARALSLAQKKLQQELMQQQIASESKNISSVISQAQQGAIDKYKAEILSVIQSNWRISQVNSKLKCVYSVSLAPDGTVLSESLVKSSGDDELDQSAKQAIVLSSPLPVPTDPSTFNHFRQLVLTLSPQGYMQSVGNS